MTINTNKLTTVPGPMTLYVGVEDRKLKLLRMTLRYWVRYPFFISHAHRLHEYLNERNSDWLPLFHANIRRYHSVIFKYCDKRFSPKERVDQIINTFDDMSAALPRHVIDELVAKNSIKLAQLTDRFSLYLNLNAIDHFEGYYSLNIKDDSKDRFYDASFATIDHKYLLIASMQGPKGEQAAEVVRQLTKEFHGARPMFLLVDAFRMVTEALNSTGKVQLQLAGVPHHCQTKVRKTGRKRMFFMYDDFWKENGAQDDGRYWVMSTQIEQRPLEDIQSKKRSMYRKRYAMYDAMREQIMSVLNPKG